MDYKYLAVDDNNNKFYVNNLHYRKFLRDHGCRTVCYYSLDTHCTLLIAEKLPNGNIIKCDYFDYLEV